MRTPASESEVRERGSGLELSDAEFLLAGLGDTVAVGLERE